MDSSAERFDQLVNENGYYCDEEGEDHEVETYLVEEFSSAHLNDNLVSFIKPLCYLGVLVRHIDDDIALVSQALIGFSHVFVRFKAELLDVM